MTYTLMLQAAYVQITSKARRCFCVHAMSRTRLVSCIVFVHAAASLAKNFTRCFKCDDTPKLAMLGEVIYALVINARFTRHSEQLQSMPCQRVLSYRFRIYESLPPAIAVGIFLDSSVYERLSSPP